LTCECISANVVDLIHFSRLIVSVLLAASYSLLCRLSYANVRHLTMRNSTVALSCCILLVLICALCKHKCGYHISCNRSQVSYTSRVSNRNQGLTSNTIELMVLLHRTVLRYILRDILRYIGAYWYVNTASEISKKRKSYTKIKIRSR